MFGIYWNKRNGNRYFQSQLLKSNEPKQVNLMVQAASIQMQPQNKSFSI